jgi:hypothetical protein
MFLGRVDGANMTRALAIGVTTAVLFGAVQIGAAQQPVATTSSPRPIDALLELPRLDPAVRIGSLKRQSTPVGVVMDAVVSTTRLTVHYEQSVPELDKICSVELSNASLDEALQAVLGANAIAYTVLGAKQVFVYSNTPANLEKYSWSVRAFQILHADPQALAAMANRQFVISSSGIRPIIVVAAAPARVINVRATGEKMALIAKLIADNDR